MLKRIRLLIIFSFVLLCNQTIIKAQFLPDAGIWTTVNLDLAVSTKTSFFLTQEIRTKDELRRLDLLYTKIGVEYKLSKHLKTSIGYKFKQKFMPENFFSFRHRVEWDILIKKRLGHFKLSYRHRLQTEVRNFYSSEAGRYPEWFSRSKLLLKYALKKNIDAYVSTELKYQIYSPLDHETDNFFTNARYQLGFDYEMKSNHTIGLYYLIDDEFNIKNPEDLHVIGLEWTIPLKNKNKEEKERIKALD